MLYHSQFMWCLEFEHARQLLPLSNGVTFSAFLFLFKMSGLRCNSVAECLPSTGKALSSIANTAIKGKSKSACQERVGRPRSSEGCVKLCK